LAYFINFYVSCKKLVSKNPLSEHGPVTVWALVDGVGHWAGARVNAGKAGIPDVGAVLQGFDLTSQFLP
jgi:hypothetical protein